MRNGSIDLNHINKEAKTKRNNEKNNIENKRNNNGIDYETDDENSNEKGKIKRIITIIVLLIIMIFIYFQIFQIFQYTFGKIDKEKLWLYNSFGSVINIFKDKTPNTTTEDFSLKFAALGDVYGTANIISGAKTTSGYDFSTGMDKVKEVLSKYDVVSASLETPVADKTLGYTSKTLYNTPVEILDMLKNLNVSVLATATKHSMDKGEKGITQTITNIKSKEMQQVGISSEIRKDPVVVTKNGINIGVLSYATSSNVKIPLKKEYLLNILDEDVLKKDIEFLKNKNVDFIVSYLNIPNEDSIMTDSLQKSNVETLFENGVDIVLGGGSMVVQEGTEDQIEINRKTKTYIRNVFFG